jgi:hypothetical protein
MSAVPKEHLALLKEVYADPIALELLKAKCRWEHMSQTAIIASYGDPRKWQSYAEAKQEQVGWASESPMLNGM